MLPQILLPQPITTADRMINVTIAIISKSTDDRFFRSFVQADILFITLLLNLFNVVFFLGFSTICRQL